ncbi:MAG: TetR/AcrR family transcriptional regulator [Thermodesulfobacteriota bacterium]
MSSKTENTARDRIIETALDLFYKQGYLATGINQIIAESEVAKATFYSNFASKEALCIAYLQARHSLWMGWLRESVEGNETPKEKLLGVFLFLKKWMQESNYRGCAFLNIASEVPLQDSKIRSEVTNHKEDLQAYLKELILDVFESDKTHEESDAQQLARMIYVLVEGAIVSSQNFNNIWPIEAAQEAAESLLTK